MSKRAAQAAQRSTAPQRKRWDRKQAFIALVAIVLVALMVGSGLLVLIH